MKLEDIVNDIKSFGLKVSEDSQGLSYLFGYDDEFFGYVVKATYTVRIHYREHGKPPLIDSFFYDKQKFKEALDQCTEAFNSNVKYRKIQKIKNICKEDFDE